MVNVTEQSAAQLRESHEEQIFRCATPYYREPLVLASGSGSRVRDVEGREYLDFYAGILTTSVGHCHPEVVGRVQKQLRMLGHVSTLYLNEPQIEAAQRLSAITPGRLDRVLFTNSGTEAIETAVALACMHTGRSEIIALRHSYSGRSILATNLTGQAPWRASGSVLPGIKHVKAPYPYRCVFRTPCDSGCVEALADDLVEAIETTTSGRPAALLAESILGAGGFIVPHPGYFERVSEIIRDYGGLFISDEVQSGFGRTGRRWFAIEHWGVEPDIMVMAKGIANGMPVGATVTRSEIADAWTAKTISTFGGNPVSTAAVAATLNVMVAEDVPSRAQDRGEQLRVGLESIAAEHAWVGEVRGMGLMQALELVESPESKVPNSRHAALLLEAAREEGLLVGIGGLNGHVIRIGPSLLIGEAEVDEGLSKLRRACGRVENDV